MEEHINKIEEFLTNNDWMKNESEFENIMYEIRDSLTSNGVGIEAVEPILELMERYPLVSFGSPGALTHFMETFYKKGYEALLERSVRKAPTVHTVWLLNRLINGATDEKALEYIQIMKSIYGYCNLHQEIRDVAKALLEYHEEFDNYTA